MSPIDLTHTSVFFAITGFKIYIIAFADLESLKVYLRGFGLAFDGIAGVLTDRIATKELRTDFECAAVVEELVLVFIDDGGITRRRDVEGAVGKKLEDGFRTLLASTLRGEISLPLALDIPGAKAANDASQQPLSNIRLLFR